MLISRVGFSPLLCALHMAEINLILSNGTFPVVNRPTRYQFVISLFMIRLLSVSSSVARYRNQ